MTAPFASSDEFDDLVDLLAPIPPDRRGPIARMAFDPLGPCPICDEPVRRCDARDLVDEGIAHLRCTGREIPPDPPPEGYEAAKRKEEAKLERLREEGS